jgi:imidazolonepropionase-like amidohydrolase
MKKLTQRTLINKILGVLVMTGSLSFSALATDIVPGAKQTNPVLIKGGTLYTVTDGVQTNTDLLFENGVISKIAVGINAPANAQVIDASGKHIYPGLIGMTTNVGLVEVGAVRSTRDDSETGRATPEVKAHIAFNADSEITPTLRTNGITHVQIAPGGRGLNGQSSLMQLDGWNWQDALVKSSTGMHLRWPNVGINKAWWEKRPAKKQKEANEKAQTELKKLFETMKAYAKARDQDKNQLVDLRWEAMRPVLKGEVPLYVHADDYRQIEQAIHFALEEKLSIVLVSARDADKAIDLIKSNNVPIIYTSAWGRTWRSDEAYDKAYATPAFLEKSGINYALAIDGNWPARNLAFAAGQSIAYGVSPEMALKSITLAPAEILGVADKMGSLTVGKQANIIISKGDLFDHITHKVELMFIDGRSVDLDDRHKKLYRKYSQKPKAQ